MKNFQYFLGTIVIAGFLGVIWVFVSRQLSLSEAVTNVILILIGNLSSMANQVVQYYFGSSSGSARKDELRSTALEKKET